MPLNSLNFSPWNPEGFTVTTWIQLKSQNGQQVNKTRSDNISDDDGPFREIAPEKSHPKDGKMEKVVSSCEIMPQ